MEKIDHIGIAVKSLEDSLVFYRDLLGLSEEGREEVTEQQVRVSFLPLGESKVELLEPTTPESPVEKFIQTRGEGIHHVAIRVRHLEEKLQELRDKGVRLLDETPRRGAGGSLIAFVHPRSTGGVLLELCEKPLD